MSPSNPSTKICQNRCARVELLPPGRAGYYGVLVRTSTSAQQRRPPFVSTMIRPFHSLHSTPPSRERHPPSTSRLTTNLMAATTPAHRHTTNSRRRAPAMAPRRSSRGAAKAKSVDYSEMAYASPQCPLHFISPRRTGASYIGDWNHIKMAGGTAATPATPTPRTRRWRRRSRRSRGSRGNRRRTTARAAAAARRPALGAAARAARPCRCRAGPARRRRATSALLRWRGVSASSSSAAGLDTPCVDFVDTGELRPKPKPIRYPAPSIKTTHTLVH